MSKSASNYQEKLVKIKDYTNLGINSRKFYAKNPNFTRAEKWLISYYYNLAEKENYLAYRGKDEIPNVKFVRTKKRAEKKGKRFSGYFVPGAKTTDKVTKRRGKTIISAEHWEKTYIPLPFLDYSDEYEDIYSHIYDETIDEKITDSTYFTIVLLNGFEIGRGQTPVKAEKRAQKYVDYDGDREEKISDLTEKIEELLRRAQDRYKMSKKDVLISGIFIWNFKKQRKPNNKERKTAKRGKKK